ncbi:hypothetical protein [Streptomyces sp. NPDC051561]|uniref:hypothetical protein n=1 Tax=Streptomyces sp. NPDC051561 TaxID=3365658 RepID=UPI0037B31E95
MSVGRAWRVIVGVGGGLYLLGSGLSGLHTQLTGVKGYFTPEYCHSTAGRHGDPQYKCEGSFVDTAGTFIIPRLEIDQTYSEHPGTGRVSVFVDAQGSDTAVTDDRNASLGMAGGGALILTVAVGFGVRWARRSRREDEARQRAAVAMA